MNKATQLAIANDTSAMPPKTILLSQMMRELSAQPGFTEQLLGYLDKGQKNGALLTPELFDTFRKLVLGKDWNGLDRFPGWTIRRITRTVELGEDLLAKSGSDAADPASTQGSGWDRTPWTTRIRCKPGRAIRPARLLRRGP